MQSKVSMVTACYNKVKYIADMLDSVIAQTWDNIEVILVNDGSDDGTREILTAYEQKLLNRGYSVTIIDQNNMGVAAAVKAGLMRVTGAYVCLPDCDDLLHPDYVSALASGLGVHPEVNIAYCDSKRGKYHFDFYLREPRARVLSYFEDFALKEYLLRQRMWSVCLLMFRASLIGKLKIASNFITDICRTQEPQIWLPLLISEREMLYIPKPLYDYVKRENSIITSQNSVEDFVNHKNKYYELMHRILESVGLSDKKLSEYKGILNISWYFHLYSKLGRYSNLSYDIEKYSHGFVQTVNNTKLFPVELTKKMISEYGFFVVYGAICAFIMDKRIGNLGLYEKLISGKGRLVAYGAGEIAQSRLPDVIKNGVIPDVVWDNKEFNGKEICNIQIHKPDVQMLTHNDIIIIFLNGNVDILDAFKSTEASVIHYTEVISAISARFLATMQENG